MTKCVLKQNRTSMKIGRGKKKEKRQQTVLYIANTSRHIQQILQLFPFLLVIVSSSIFPPSFFQ